jgi:hypothetical protein
MRFLERLYRFVRGGVKKGRPRPPRKSRRKSATPKRGPPTVLKEQEVDPRRLLAVKRELRRLE